MIKWYTTFADEKKNNNDNDTTTAPNGMCVASSCMCISLSNFRFYILKHARIQRTHIYSTRHTDSVHQIVIIGTEPEAKRNKTENSGHVRKMALHPCTRRQTRTHSLAHTRTHIHTHARAPTKHLINKKRNVHVSFGGNAFGIFWTYFFLFLERVTHPSYGREVYSKIPFFFIC